MVKYHDPSWGLSDNVFLGKWLGVAHNVGQAMTYWVLKSNGYVITRSTVRPLTREEERSEEEKANKVEFIRCIEEMVGDFDLELINTDDFGQNEHMVEPLYRASKESIDDGIEPLEHVADVSPGPDALVNAEVFLPDGDKYEIARVLGRKRQADGFFIGRKHQNPILDSRVFMVDFPDGDQKDIAYNILAEHLY
jgi:hypothetical protein